MEKLLNDFSQTNLICKLCGLCFQGVILICIIKILYLIFKKKCMIPYIILKFIISVTENLVQNIL